MSRPCPLHPTAPVKGAAYARLTDGTRKRLTRHQLLTGNYPDGTVDIITGIQGSLHPKHAGVDRTVTRLTPQEAAAAIREPSKAARIARAAIPHTELLEFDEHGTPTLFECTGTIYTINGKQVTFGTPPGVRWGTDIETLPRNPYRLAGLDVTTPEGRTLAMQYGAAIAAVAVAACQTCGTQLNCIRCNPPTNNQANLKPDPLITQRRQVLTIIGKGDGRNVDTTLVDALVLAGTHGDLAATANLKALAALGEQMIAYERDKVFQRTIPTEERDAALAMNDDEWHAWVKTVTDKHITAPTHAIDEERATIWKLRDEKVISDEEAAVRLEQLATERANLDTPFRELSRIRAMRTARTHEIDLENLYFVHETRYDVTRDENGDILLRPAEDHYDEVHRTTLHFTINGLVTGHLWRENVTEGRMIVVRASDLIAANPGALSNLYAIDTFLAPPPGEPLRLPNGATHVIEYADLPAQEAGDRNEARTAAIRDFLEERNAQTFTIGQHHSDPGPDARMQELAQQLGVTSTLHGSTTSETYERMFHTAATLSGRLPQMCLHPGWLATCSDNERQRMVAHDRWGGTTITRYSDPDDLTIG